MFKKIAHRSPTVTVTERPEVNGRAGPQGTDPRVSPSPNVLFWTERVISQKKAHTLFFSRRNHIIWVYRNGELVSEVDFSKRSHLGGGEVGNSYTPGGSGRGCLRAGVSPTLSLQILMGVATARPPPAASPAAPGATFQPAPTCQVL